MRLGSSGPCRDNQIKKNRVVSDYQLLVRVDTAMNWPVRYRLLPDWQVRLLGDGWKQNKNEAV
jgi:hypothetical protein